MTQMVAWIPLSNTISVKKWDIVHVLDACHDIQISLRTLRCKLKTMQLPKSPNITDEAVRQIITRENFEGHLQDMVIASCGINSRQQLESK